MSKKNKNFGNENPEIYNMDDIGYMTDEALYDRANRLENDRNRVVASGRDPYLWEVEIAYLRREQSMRRTRAELHQEYVQKFAVNLGAETEASAQVANENGGEVLN